VNAVTAGQAAHEEWTGRYLQRLAGFDPALASRFAERSAWNDPATLREDWEAIARRAIAVTPVSNRLSLAMCGDHPGKVHAQMLDEALAGQHAWVCLRALADIAEAKSAAITIEPARERGAPGEPSRTDVIGQLDEQLTEAGNAVDDYRAEVRRIGLELDALREQLATATGALRDIKDSYDTGTAAHDWARKALDDIGGVKPAQPGEATRLREQLQGIREQLGNLASGMEMSARTSDPSKKSEIEYGCARAVRAIARTVK
jgi:hypothetical protein